MKFRLFIVAMLFFFLGLSPIEGFSKIFVVAHDTNFMPFEFKDKDGQYVGFDIDLWKAIADKADIPYVFQPMDFNGIIPGLQTGNIEIAIAGMSITPERVRVVDFSHPYYNSGLVILVRQDEKSVHTIDDLAEKVVAVKTGTSSVDFMKAFGKAGSLKLFPNNEGMFFELINGGADAIVFDKPVLEAFIGTVGKGKGKIVGPVYEGHPYGIAFSKGNSTLISKVNNALAELKKNGTYAEIYKKWFGVMPQENDSQ